MEEVTRQEPEAGAACTSTGKKRFLGSMTVDLALNARPKQAYFKILCIYSLKK